MSIIALTIFLFTIGVGGLIVYNAYLALKRSSIRDKVTELKLVDDQHGEVVEANKRFTNTKEKRQEIKKFNDQ